MKDFTSKAFILILLLCLSIKVTAQESNQSYDIWELDDFESKVLAEKDEFWVIDFWASWCGPCIASMPELKATQQRFEKEKVRFFSVSWDKNSIRWNAALQQFNMPWTQILIPDVRNTPFIDQHFKHKAIPSLFVVFPNGKIKKVRDTDQLTSLLVKKISAQEK